MKEKYKVSDTYEFEKETLGYVNTMKEVRLLAKARMIDTDGECVIELRELNPVSGKYKFVEYIEEV